MNDQEDLRSKVASLLRDKRAIADKVTLLGTQVVAARRKVEEEFQEEISLAVSAWGLLDQEMRNLQGVCQNKFHVDVAQFGRCPDCNLLKPDP